MNSKIVSKFVDVLAIIYLYPSFLLQSRMYICHEKMGKGRYKKILL